MTMISRCTTFTESSSSLSPSISSLLGFCKTIQNLKQVHTQIIQRGVEQDHFIILRFISLCGSHSRNTQYVTSVFDRVFQPSIYIWNTLFKCYSEHSSVATAFSLFTRMKRAVNVLPDKYTFSSLVRACSNGLSLKEGETIHGLIVRYGADGNVYVGLNLVDFYGKCQMIDSARKMFDKMRVRNEVSWTCMMVVYLNFGNLGEAKKLFDEMPVRNQVTWNAMINGLVKFGDLNGARKLFDEMPERNVVSFTAISMAMLRQGIWQLQGVCLISPRTEISLLGRL